MAGTAIVPYGNYYEPNFTMGQPPVDPWTGGPTRAINLEPIKSAGRMAGRGARLTGQILGPVAAADVAVNAMNPLKMDKAGYEAYGNKLGGMANIVPPAVLGAVTNMFGLAPNSFNPIKQWKNNVVGAYNDIRTNLFGGKQQTPTTAIPSPTQAIKGDNAYEGFDDQYRSFASVNAEQNAADARANAYTPAERQMLAISPNPYGTNEPYFDNAGIKRAGYDRMQMNTYDPNKAVGLPGMNPATGVGGSGVGAALQAAAARGDWDAINKYYASKGQSFAGMPPPGGAMGNYGDLYNRAFGPGIKSRRGRDRAAAILQQGMQDERAMDRQRLMNEGAINVETMRGKTASETAKFNAMLGGISRDRATKQRNLAAQANTANNYIKFFGTPEAQMQLRNLSPEEQKQRIAAFDEARRVVERFSSGGYDAELFSAPDIYDNYETISEEDRARFGLADGGLVEGYAQGGQIQPVLNPMGNMGMPSSMANLDPVIRQYAQYVSTASQYGLQPVEFPKFIDLLGAARTKLATLPTQGGATGFADGGKVEEDNMYYVKQYDEQGGFTGYKAYPRSEMPKDDSGRPYWVPQEEWKKNAPSDNQYAGGGAVGPFGDFSRASRRLDTTRAGEDPYTYQAKVDELVRQYVPNAVPGAASPDEFTRLIQAGLAARNMQFPTALPKPWGTAKNLSNYAGGGAIPVAGQQVLGPGGPKSDSIPAVIDGKRPAALSTGEFVMPTEAVQFFGTDKLNKMIQKARSQ